MQGFTKHQEARSPSFIADDGTLSFGRKEIDSLVQLAQTGTGVARVCMHRSVQDGLHSMLVAQTSLRYWKPKRHVDKFKLFHIVRGSMLVVLFDEQGQVFYSEVLEPKDRLSVLVPANTFHTNIALTEVVVHHEVIEGPYTPDETGRELADFAPSESDSVASTRYVHELATKRVRAK